VGGRQAGKARYEDIFHAQISSTPFPVQVFAPSLKTALKTEQSLAKMACHCQARTWRLRRNISNTAGTAAPYRPPSPAALAPPTTTW
jgi:hypothetical protein